MVKTTQKAIVRNCILAGNTGASGELANYGGGALEVEDCTIGPGPRIGLMCSGGTLLLSRSTVMNHVNPLFAAGIWLKTGVVATILNSTISGNTSYSIAGGLNLETGSGGARADLTNVTVYNDGAPTGGNLNLANSPDISLTLTNSIVAKPYAGANCYGKLPTSSTYCIASDNVCLTSGPGNWVNTDPLLGPLQDNGGRP